jgi:hypothetical protein
MESIRSGLACCRVRESRVVGRVKFVGRVKVLFRLQFRFGLKDRGCCRKKSSDRRKSQALFPIPIRLERPRLSERRAVTVGRVKVCFPIRLERPWLSERRAVTVGRVKVCFRHTVLARAMDPRLLDLGRLLRLVGSRRGLNGCCPSIRSERMNQSDRSIDQPKSIDREGVPIESTIERTLNGWKGDCL